MNPSEPVPIGPTGNGRGGTIAPMKTLYERIDQVRSRRKDLPNQLRNIAPEIPSESTRKKLHGLADSVESESSAAQLVSTFPEHCWLVTLQSSAATTDALTAMLEQAAYQHGIQVKKIRTLAYPLVLLSIAIVMTITALALLIPPFDEMYQEFDLNLPELTKGLVFASRTVTGSPLVVLIVVTVGMVALAGLLWIWVGDTAIKRTLLGPSTNVTSIRQSLATVALQLAELIDDGLSLGHSLRIVAESNPDRTMQRILGDLAVHVDKNNSDLQKTRAAMILPPNFLFALNPSTQGGVSNVTPPNTTMLRELATSYRELSIRRKDWISFILAQITVIGVGLLIAVIVIALFMPLISLVTSLSG